MSIVLAQINPTVGDFDGNFALMRDAAARAAADLVVFPELSVCGYMPRDLLEEPAFLDGCERVLDQLCELEHTMLVGAPIRVDGPGKPLINAAVLIRGGERTIVAKRLLPTYDVFDEKRYFRGGTEASVIEVGDKRIGVTVCEDMWPDELYDADPVAELAAKGVDLVVNLSASPYEQGKPAYRRELARKHGVPLALCNLVGGNDQLVFDGNSFFTGGAHGAHCATDLVRIDEACEPAEDRVEDAIVLGIRDYFAKTGFERALIGLSGGIDSAVVACLAVEALGAENVSGIGMPGPFNAAMSLEDAAELAGNLGMDFEELRIDKPFDAFREVLGSTEIGLAEENLQARIRGAYLMARANADNSLVLVPSNKSEMAMGYCTLYGDMVGALAPISDLYKTEVYALAERLPAIPRRIIERPPSAELRPDQVDSDSLPPYDVLDGILRQHLEERKGPDAITGFDPAVVRRVLRAVSLTEYKRQQAAPVLKVSSKAFDLGRRYPIVERFRGGTR